LLSALHFVHQRVKKEVRGFLSEENTDVCLYTCVRNEHEHADIASPTSLSGLTGRGCARSRGCPCGGRALPCLLRVLPYLLLSFFRLLLSSFVFFFLLLSSPLLSSPLLSSSSLSFFLLLLPLLLSPPSPGPGSVPAPPGAPDPAAGPAPAGGRWWGGRERPCPPFPSSATSRPCPPPHTPPARN